MSIRCYKNDSLFHSYSVVVFQEITDIVFKIELYFQAALLGIIVTAMPPYFAMENAENHKVMTQLKIISGMVC
jgi:ATP-binding cassette subfamily A (ABC1) protein 5